jgi:hypothetical protein
VNGQALVVPADKLEVKFEGVTDPTSHPAPARSSCVVVDVRKLVALKEGGEL